MKIDKWKLFKCIAIPQVVGGIAGFLTSGSMKTFELLEKPPLAPPGWLFPVVWIILYLLMGISAYLICTSGADEEKISGAMSIYYIQLAVNFLWPIFFFLFQWYLFSFFWLLLLWVWILVMIKAFYAIDKRAAYLNIPYLLWVIFAAYLNLGIWWMNR